MVVFDWDNTLADTWMIIFKSLERTFQKMDMIPMTFEEVTRGERGIHGSLRNSFPKIFGDKWQEAREHYYDSFKAVHLDEIKPIDGAENLLKALKNSEISMCVVSNKTGIYLREEVEHLGWSEYFISIVGATDAKDDKPTHYPVALALEHSAVAFDMHNYQEDIWMIGDSVTDLQTAKSSAIVGVLYGDNEEAKRMHFDGEIKHPIHIRNHDELLTLIGSS